MVIMFGGLAAGLLAGLYAFLLQVRGKDFEDFGPCLDATAKMRILITMAAVQTGMTVAMMLLINPGQHSYAAYLPTGIWVPVLAICDACWAAGIFALNLVREKEAKIQEAARQAA